jgi:hypothetical protein
MIPHWLIVSIDVIHVAAIALLVTAAAMTFVSIVGLVARKMR